MWLLGTAASCGATTKAVARATPTSWPVPAFPSSRALGSAGADEDVRRRYAMYAHGAVFAEVKVDPGSGTDPLHAPRWCLRGGPGNQPAAGEQPVSRRHDLGFEFALHEEAVMDRRSGRLLNANLGEYHVPVNADVPSIEAILVDEHDSLVNPLGVKGVGEIGITGTAGAIVNAVRHATGIRVRHAPIRLERLLGVDAENWNHVTIDAV